MILLTISLPHQGRFIMTMCVQLPLFIHTKKQLLLPDLSPTHGTSKSQYTSYQFYLTHILCHFFILDSLQRPKYLQATSFHVHPTKTSQLLVLYTIPNLSLTHFLVHSDDITYCIIVFYFIVHDSLPYDQS